MSLKDFSQILSEHELQLYTKLQPFPSGYPEHEMSEENYQAIFDRSNSFFTLEFVEFVVNSNSKETNFMKILDGAIQGELCLMEELVEVEDRELCLQSMEGLLNRGLLPSLKYIFNQIRTQRFQDTSYEQAEEFRASQEYEEQS